MTLSVFFAVFFLSPNKTFVLSILGIVAFEDLNFFLKIFFCNINFYV